MRGYRIEYLDLELSPSPESQEKERILERIRQQDPEAKARLDLKTPAELEKLMAAPSMLVLMLQLSEGKRFDLIVADIIKRLPSEEDYPVYQVFGVICSFYQYGITTPPEVLPLCLPKYSSNEVQNVVDLAIHPEHPELKGLVNTIFKRGFEGLTTIHELIAQTAMTVKYSRSRGENLPYSCNSLEDHLRAALQALDASEETHKRWVYHGLRLLAINGKAALVRQVISDYADQIQFLQQGGRISDWSHLAKMYEAAGLLAERDRCLNAILSTEPQSSWEWEYGLSLIERLGTNQQKQEAISQTSTWLEAHPENWLVRRQYIVLVEKQGTLEQKQKEIAQTTTWLQQHSEDYHVRTQYLALIEQCGTTQQKQQAIAQTDTWLQQHSKDTYVRTKYLALIEQYGTPEQKKQAIAQTTTWLQQHPEDHHVRYKYLALIGHCGTTQQKQQAIGAQTTAWLQQHPEDVSVRTQYLALIGQCGTQEQKEQAIAQTDTWLQKHPEDVSVRENYLALIGQCGTPEQKQEAITQTVRWLQNHTDDTNVRTQYLALIGQYGTIQQQREAIAQTAIWLQNHTDDTNVRTQYLALIGQYGTIQQQREAIAQTAIWLAHYPNYSTVREIYLAVVGKAGKDIIDVESIISQQWQWISQQLRVEQSLWEAFLPVLYHHAQPQLIQEAVNLALKQYPENTSIICLVFAYFRDELDYETCYQLADFLRQSRLPTNKWQNFIHAANFFRDYGELDTAEWMYRRILKAAKLRASKHGNDMQKTIKFATLSYARLLLLRNPPDPYTAINHLGPILAENPKHCVAHWYMAHCYQAKGRKLYRQAINHFEKAIEFDQQKNGHFWYDFGCFYRDAMENPTEARKCFENSLNQKINLPACVDLAELEVKDGNFERTRELLQKGLALVPITRPEKEQWEKLQPRIQQLQTQLN
jgi:protein involved in ribonucleotide reduction